MGKQCKHVHHPATARIKWTKNINKAIIKCYYLTDVFDNE